MRELSAPRTVEGILPARETIEGAGVHLRRAFGNAQVPRLDPFLLLDDFRSENPAEFVAGFPWHPHRGIETVTYMLDGYVEHEDSLGNKGVIGRGDVQWMTSGSGIIHQEMPKFRSPTDPFMGGFQLWVNLPKSHKMMGPRYQEVQRATIPEVEAAKGVAVKVIAGEVNGVRGPVKDIVVEPHYLDVKMAAGSTWRRALPEGHNAFGYVLRGRGAFADGGEDVDSENLVLFGRKGSGVHVHAKDELRFLLVSGQPIGEPVSWWGPIVMNTRKEIEIAIEEYREGTFTKDSHGGSRQGTPGASPQ